MSLDKNCVNVMSDQRDEYESTLSDKMSRGPMTRDQLYEMVWTQPMLKIAARFGVSSSYMARVCSALNVPRPQRGYWEKLKVGRAPTVPLLPEARPGDELVWDRSGQNPLTLRPTPRPSNSNTEKHVTPLAKKKTIHPLTVGAKELFETGRLSYQSGYLKPAKKLLMDIAVTKAGLDKALSFANQLYLALEASGHRVIIAPQSERFHRAPVDEREQQKTSRGYTNLWSPIRQTVVYIGTVAIGLTIIEMSEEVSLRYVNGEYVRESDYIPTKRGRYAVDRTWTTTKDLGSGRICLQAYSPYARTQWVQQWRETKNGNLAGRISEIVRELERFAPELIKLVEEGQRQAELEMQKWKEQQEKWRKEEAERRAVETLKESKAELARIINDWTEATRVEQFFVEMAARAELLEHEDRKIIEERLIQARALVSGSDFIERLRNWKLPVKL